MRAWPVTSVAHRTAVVRTLLRSAMHRAHVAYFGLRCRCLMTRGFRGGLSFAAASAACETQHCSGTNAISDAPWQSSQLIATARTYRRIAVMSCKSG